MVSDQMKKGAPYKKIESILISQPKPERSPYFQLAEKYGIRVDWRQFIHVEGISEREFRKQRINPEKFSSIIFTSKKSIDHFFRLLEGMRLEMPSTTKYFCLTETIANYLQKFIVYRKRKVFIGKRNIEDLQPSLSRFKDQEKFLLPCSNLGAKAVSNFLTEHEYDWQESLMYRTVSSDLSDLRDIYYDVLIFFSPLGIESLFENFPDFKQNDTRIAVFGDLTEKAVLERGLTVNIKAPVPGTPSMTLALSNYLDISNNGKAK